jgi:hypothetical protein
MTLSSATATSNRKHARSNAATARFAAVAIAACAGGVASQAWAASIITLPNPTYSLNITAGADLGGQVQDITGPGVTSAAAVGIYGSTASASVNISLSPNPSILATGSVATTPFDYAAGASMDVDSQLDYSFIIIDTNNPSLSVPIPVSVKASGGMSFSGTGSNGVPLLSQFFVFGILDDQLSNTIFQGSLYPGPTSWADNNTYLMQTDVVYNVGLIAQADLTVLGGDGDGAGTVSAFVDPTFALGPGVINPGQYAFVFSPGIGNAPAVVPEPSTWAMTLIGFAGLGFARCRGARKRQPAVSAA